MQQPHNSLLPWLIQQTQPWHHSKTPTLWVELTYMCAAHNLWPREYLMTCTCSAINDLCCYILIVYKTWAQRAWTHHPGQFALCPQEVSKRDEQWRKGLTLKLFTRKKRQTVLEFKVLILRYLLFLMFKLLSCVKMKSFISFNVYFRLF